MDSCDSVTGCVNVPDDGFCEEGDRCTDNFCDATLDCQFTTVVCDDGDACTDDSCEQTQGCINTPKRCGDSDICNGDETCDKETGCVPGTPLNCNDGNPCTVDFCDQVGGCNFATPVVCDPTGNPCTFFECDPFAACDPDDPVTCCVKKDVVCDDGNVCTDDSCNPASGCQSVNDTASCEDGNFCTLNDVCVGGNCQSGPPPDCDDGNVCTDDSCDTSTGCQNADNSDPCDDDDACSTADTCAGGTCVGGTPLDCDDQNACTLDSCDSATGCESTPAGDACDDGDPCTVDSCNPLDGSCESTPLVCDDGNSCTQDVCVNGEYVSEGAFTDHFFGYQIGRSRHGPKLKIERDVLLEDQFGEKKVRVKRLVGLYNPADKNSEGICQQEVHLKAYTIRTYRHHDREHDDHHDYTPLHGGGGSHKGDDDDDDDDRPRRRLKNIRVVNQFGTFIVDIKKPERLLVPASKGHDGPAPDLGTHDVDHFLCYRVKRSRGAPRFPSHINASVVDQFDQPKTYRLRTRNIRLCNPVDKNGEGIKNPEAHLMCFQVKGSPRHERVKGLFVNDQFGLHKVDTRKERELCVPSIKILP